MKKSVVLVMAVFVTVMIVFVLSIVDWDYERLVPDNGWLLAEPLGFLLLLVLLAAAVWCVDWLQRFAMRAIGAKRAVPRDRQD